MAAQAGQNQSDTSLSMLWAVIAMVVVLMILWFIPATHYYIVAAFFKIKLFEIALISLFTSGLDVLQQQIHNTSPATATMAQVYYVAENVGKFMSIPIAVILIALAVFTYKNNIASRFRSTFNMKRLLTQEKENWPQVTPVSKVDLLNEDINKGPWAMAMTPMQFAKKYKLLKLEQKATSKTGLSKDIQTVASIIPERASRILIRQVGKPWTSADDLPIYAKALFTIFGIKADAETELANKLLRRIAASADKGQLDFTGIEENFQRVKKLKLVKKVVANHAYVLTVMASMLEIARSDGVLASAEFLWLKPLDRSLWYMLNTVGRETVVTEIAGAYAHWLAEKEIGRKLTVPMIRQATEALGDAITEVVYIPDEEEEA